MGWPDDVKQITPEVSLMNYKIELFKTDGWPIESFVVLQVTFSFL